MFPSDFGFDVKKGTNHSLWQIYKNVQVSPKLYFLLRYLGYKLSKRKPSLGMNTVVSLEIGMVKWSKVLNLPFI